MTLFRLATLATLLLSAATWRGSCVDFDGQTIHARVDAEADRLELVLVYHDLHTTEQDPTGALAQLERLRAGERWFAFASNWPLGFHVDELQDDAPPADTPAGQLVRALDARVAVRPGPVWESVDGRLHAWQHVDVDGFSELLALGNAALREGLAEAEAREEFYADLGVSDAASLALLETALAAEADLLELRGAALAFRVPLSPEGFDDLARLSLGALLGRVAGTLLDEEGSDQQLDAVFSTLAESHWAVERRPDALTFLLGDPRGGPWVIELAPSGTSHPRGLGRALRDAGWEIGSPEVPELLDRWLDARR